MTNIRGRIAAAAVIGVLFAAPAVAHASTVELDCGTGLQPVAEPDVGPPSAGSGLLGSGSAAGSGLLGSGSASGSGFGSH